ncbi:Heterochromatin Protein 1b [Carabus blaptoides fortunei]
MNKRTKEDETDDVYDVEVVLDRKIIDGVTFYLLKWIGYSDEYNTWEPEENLHCKGLIEDYLRRPDKILGATEHNGDLAFIVRTKSRKTDLLASVMAYKQCPAMVLEFFENRLFWNTNESEEKTLLMSDAVVRKMRKRIGPRPNGYLNHLAPRAIIGAVKTSEGLLFLMKWRDSDQFDLIPSDEANAQYTKYVLEFYEEKLKWEDEIPDGISEQL